MTQQKIDIKGTPCWVTVDNFRYYDIEKGAVTTKSFVSWFSFAEPGLIFGRPVVDQEGHAAIFESFHAAMAASVKLAEASLS